MNFVKERLTPDMANKEEVSLTLSCLRSYLSLFVPYVQNISACELCDDCIVDLITQRAEKKKNVGSI